MDIIVLKRDKIIRTSEKVHNWLPNACKTALKVNDGSRQNLLWK